MDFTQALYTAEHLINAPLIHKGKVRELYDLGEYNLIVVTDRISAFGFILSPAIPGKGIVLNKLSEFWFDITKELQTNHVIHCDVKKLKDIIVNIEMLEGRIMVCKKAKRIDVECVVRGYLTGGGWRQYQQTGKVNGVKLHGNLRKNEKLDFPMFTPASKKDEGHDVDIAFHDLVEQVGEYTANRLREKSLELYDFAHKLCKKKGILMADTKFEFGFVDNEIILIDEIFTPDSSRFWDLDKYVLDVEIDSMDKEVIRSYLSNSGWDKKSAPDPLPESIVEKTAQNYENIYNRLVNT